MDGRAGENDALDADERHQHVDRQQHADDRAERIGRIDRADGALAGAAAHELVRQQRQRHARAKGRRNHDQRGDQLADQVESDIAAARAREDARETTP